VHLTRNDVILINQYTKNKDNLTRRKFGKSELKTSFGLNLTFGLIFMLCSESLDQPMTNPKMSAQPIHSLD